jgi:hypothetical protein
MALTSEEAKRFIAALLQACLNVVQQTELTSPGDSDTLVFTQQPIDFKDPATGDQFYGLVHVFVSPDAEAVRVLDAELKRIEKRG